jgi:hypothetical protein
MMKDQVAPLIFLGHYRKRPDGRNIAKDTRAKGGDNLYKELENMMAVRKEITSKRRELRNCEIYERKAT